MVAKDQTYDCVVRYFEDNSSSAVDYSDITEFDPHKEPFISFAKNNFFFLEDVAIKRALHCYNTGEVPRGFKWPKWTLSRKDQVKNFFNFFLKKT